MIIDKPFTPEIQRVLPSGYRKHSVIVFYDVTEVNCASSWQDGSRAEYALVNLQTGHGTDCNKCVAFGLRPEPGEHGVQIPDGHCIVQCGISRGKSACAVIYLKTPDPAIELAAVEA